MSKLGRRQFVGAGLAGLLSPRLAWPSQPGIDVVIIGAGLSGLVAASDLVAAGKEVAVLEARDRVGGRTLNQPLDGGGSVEAGGQFVGPDHEAILTLARDLGIATFKTYAGTVEGSRDNLVALSPEMLELVGDLETSGKDLPTGNPWAAPRAAEWDRLTVAEFVTGRRTNPLTRAQVDRSVRRMLGAGPTEVSFLWWLYLLRSGGGYRALEAVEGGARERQFVGGAQALSVALAKRLDQRVVVNSPVARITLKSGGVEVTTRIANIKARRVVVAMSPADASHLQFAAPLPPERIQLMASWRLTPGFKANLVFDHPSWRDSGSTGIWSSADGRVSTFDSTPEGGTPGIISVIADRSVLPPQRLRRQAALVSQIAAGLGDLAEPKWYREQEWNDAFNGGAWSALPPETLVPLGPWLRRPVDRIHWAGTETAEVSTGLMDGAVRAGHRAAREVLDAG